MKFVGLNVALLLTSVTASVDREKVNLRRGLDGSPPECTALLKITLFEDDSETFDIECEMSDTSEILPIIGLPDMIKDKFERGEYQSGSSILKAPNAKRDGNVFKIPPGDTISIVKKMNQDKGGRGRGAGRGRRMTASGTKSTLALWVSAPDASTTTPMDDGNSGDLTDEIFGTYGDDVNLKSQYELCSNGELIYEPVNGLSTTGRTVSNGVYAISIFQSVNGVDNSIVRQAVETEANAVLGNLPNQYDNVMMCLPPGTSGSWIAYAYVNHWLSVYNNIWCNYVSAQMHEVGHNLNLAHSGEGSNEYDDQSGLMGYSYANDDTPEMCFNAPKNIQLGWYLDRQVVLTSPNYSWSGRLYGIANYDDTTSADKMFIRLDHPNDSTKTVYVSFNAKNGMNAGTAEGGDQVLIHKKDGDVEDYAKSWLQSKMNAGQTYSASIAGQTIPINVISINTASSPPYAEIQIGSGDSFPTASPTVSPTSLPSPPCASDRDVFTFQMFTDGYGEDITWKIQMKKDGVFEEYFGNGFDYGYEYGDNRGYQERYCLPNDECYRFVMLDSYGDGLCCAWGEGGYRVQFNNQVIKQSRFENSDAEGATFNCN